MVIHFITINRSTKLLKRGRMHTEEILEELRSSQINFDNLVKLNPIIKDHPMYIIARMQLDAAVENIESQKSEG